MNIQQNPGISQGPPRSTERRALDCFILSACFKKGRLDTQAFHQSTNILCTTCVFSPDRPKEQDPTRRPAPSSHRAVRHRDRHSFSASCSLERSLSMFSSTHSFGVPPLQDQSWSARPCWYAPLVQNQVTKSSKPVDEWLCISIA